MPSMSRLVYYFKYYFYTRAPLYVEGMEHGSSPNSPLFYIYLYAVIVAVVTILFVYDIRSLLREIFNTPLKKKLLIGGGLFYIAFVTELMDIFGSSISTTTILLASYFLLRVQLVYLQARIVVWLSTKLWIQIWG